MFSIDVVLRVSLLSDRMNIFSPPSLCLVDTELLLIFSVWKWKKAETTHTHTHMVVLFLVSKQCGQV